MQKKEETEAVDAIVTEVKGEVPDNILALNRFEADSLKKLLLEELTKNYKFYLQDGDKNKTIDFTKKYKFMSLQVFANEEDKTLDIIFKFAKIPFMIKLDALNKKFISKDGHEKPIENEDLARQFRNLVEDIEWE